MKITQPLFLDIFSVHLLIVFMFPGNIPHLEIPNDYVLMIQVKSNMSTQIWMVVVGEKKRTQKDPDSGCTFDSVTLL